MKYTSTVLSFWEVHTKYTKSILKVYCIPARDLTGFCIHFLKEIFSVALNSVHVTDAH